VLLAFPIKITYNQQGKVEQHMAKRDKKRLIPREETKAFIKEHNIKSIPDIQNALKELFGETLQELLEAEMDHNLGYEKNDNENKQTENRRNGHSPKTVRSEFGEIDLEIPRDREGEFDPLIVKKNQKNITGIEDQIIALYAKGVSTREIQDHLQRLYGIDASPALISNITNKIMPVIKEWQNRPLHSIYAVVFMDAIHYNVKQDGMITKKAAYVTVGIDLDGKKDVLGIWIGENESAKFWLSVLNELKNRGVEDILIISVDNLKGFSEAITACYPETKIQKCIVHQIRNSLRYYLTRI
jgi:putative transposase